MGDEIAIGEKLKKRSIMVVLWGCEDERSWAFQWGEGLQAVLGKVVLFDPRKKRMELGTKKMGRELLDVVGRERPDYFLFLTEAEVLGLDTIRKINEISPDTKTIVYFGDDDINFEDRSRYYALFADYCLVWQLQFLESYKSDGLKNVYGWNGVNTKQFKKINVEKKYDVSFIGQPLESRIEMVRFLIDNGVKVNIWGVGWGDYEEFKEYYRGFLNPEDLVKITNESKINLGLTKNQYGAPHIKGRVFEVAACGAFQLVENFNDYRKFFDDDELVMFNDKKDLVERIKYYLENGKEREKIAVKSYRKTVENYDFEVAFRKFFSETEKEKEFRRRILPSASGKVGKISMEQIKMGSENAKKQLEGFDFVGFDLQGSIDSEFKDFLQVYSLEKTGKDVSCCGYFIYSDGLGRYMKLNMYRGRERLGDESFRKLLNLSQIVVRKSFFLERFEKFLEVVKGGEVDFVDRESTAFIKIPLVTVRRLSDVNYAKIKELNENELLSAFQLSFLYELQGLVSRGGALFSPYPYKLLAKSFSKGNGFILKQVIKSYLSKDNWDRVKS